MSELLDLAQAAVEAAQAAGADYCDAYCSDSTEVSVEVEKSSINYCATIRDQGLSVRAYVNGGQGFATVQQLSLGDAREIGERAVAMARAAHSDPDFVRLPDPTEVAPVPELFDEEMAGLDAGAFVDWCLRGIEEAQSVAADAIVQGGAGAGWGQSALASSTGVAISKRASSAGLSFFVIVARGNDIGTYFEQDMARRMADLEIDSIGEKAAREALRQLGSRPVPTARVPLVLGPLATMSLIGSVIGAADAEGVQRNRRWLVGREGEQIASPVLTVREEPLVPAGLRSSEYDGEGVARQPRALIDEGVLTTYLHNSYTAFKAGVEPTGHASRGGYSSSVGISSSNLQIQPGEKTEAELIAEIDDGIYVAYAGISPNAVTGEVSTTLDFGFRIQNGECAAPISTTLIGSTGAELLGNIDAISSDYREEPGLILPSIRITDVQIASEG
ncbi:MAG: TldD/PmbA family protein [Armatimonadota bacterium]|jgi:PmbA protein